LLTHHCQWSDISCLFRFEQRVRLILFIFLLMMMYWILYTVSYFHVQSQIIESLRWKIWMLIPLRQFAEIWAASRTDKCKA
jgi:hypothetical protein